MTDFDEVFSKLQHIGWEMQTNRKQNMKTFDIRPNLLDCITNFPQTYPFECAATNRDQQQGLYGSQGQVDFNFNSEATFQQLSIRASQRLETFATTSKRLRQACDRYQNQPVKYS